jgi:hypothetical protein
MLGRRFTSSRVRKERKKRLMIQTGLGMLLALSSLFLFIELVDLKQLRIETVRFEGNVALSDQELWASMAGHLEGSYAHLFSRRNIIFLRRSTIEEGLLRDFVRLESVSVSREGLHTVIVKSAERAPKGLWCGAAETAGTCYYFDGNGLAFAQAPRLSGGTFITYIRDFHEDVAKYPENVIGSYLASPEEFHALEDFMSSLVSLGFHVERATWQNDAIDLSVRSSLESEQNVRLLLKAPLAPPYAKAFSNLASVLRTTGEDGEPLSLAGIEYIDIRFENKVFYKKSGLEIGSIDKEHLE